LKIFIIINNIFIIILTILITRDEEEDLNVHNKRVCILFGSDKIH